MAKYTLSEAAAKRIAAALAEENVRVGHLNLDDILKALRDEGFNDPMGNVRDLISMWENIDGLQHMVYLTALTLAQEALTLRRCVFNFQDHLDGIRRAAEERWPSYFDPESD